ncbi:hypothetical protein ETR37_14370 [Geobacillus sp. PK12]|nr:hypothetical protein ETR37_14370 [Geobacillus sp. PK12]
MQFEALPFAAFTEYLVDCRVTEQRRLKTHIWVCEAGGCSILRKSNENDRFRKMTVAGLLEARIDSLSHYRFGSWMDGPT